MSLLWNALRERLELGGRAGQPAQRRRALRRLCTRNTDPSAGRAHHALPHHSRGHHRTSAQRHRARSASTSPRRDGHRAYATAAAGESDSVGACGRDRRPVQPRALRLSLSRRRRPLSSRSTIPSSHGSAIHARKLLGGSIAANVIAEHSLPTFLESFARLQEDAALCTISSSTSCARIDRCCRSSSARRRCSTPQGNYSSSRSTVFDNTERKARERADRRRSTSSSRGAPAKPNRPIAPRARSWPT